MTPDTLTIVIAAISFAGTFVLARYLGRGYRERRRQREEAKREAARRLGETRQMRRARERREKR